jgi:hypothetical protein
MGGFNEHPGLFCRTNPTPENSFPCGKSKKVFYIMQLKSQSPAISVNLYQGEALKKSRYIYFVLYHQPKALDFLNFQV